MLTFRSQGLNYSVDGNSLVLPHSFHKKIALFLLEENIRLHNDQEKAGIVGKSYENVSYKQYIIHRTQ